MEKVFCTKLPCRQLDPVLGHIRPARTVTCHQEDGPGTFPSPAAIPALQAAGTSTAPSSKF